MRAHSSATIIGNRPSEAVGQVGGKLVEVGNDAGECPVGERNMPWHRRRRQAAKDDIDAGRFIFAMPFEGKAAGKAQSPRPGVRRHDPDDRPPGPTPAARQECLGFIHGRGHGCRQYGVVAFGGHAGFMPARRHKLRRMIERGKPQPHAGRRLDRRPSTLRFAQRVPELAATSADIEQIADHGHTAADQRRHLGNVVRGVDRRGVKRQRIDLTPLPGGIMRKKRQEENSQRPSHVTANCSQQTPCRWPRMESGGVYIRTPRPMRSRVTTAGGRSPGSRVNAFDHLPRNPKAPSGILGRKLAAHSCGDSRGVMRRSARTAFPFDPLREPPDLMLAVDVRGVKVDSVHAWPPRGLTGFAKCNRVDERMRAHLDVDDGVHAGTGRPDK